jgi:tetratricopeptide (TPR) repeat protein
VHTRAFFYRPEITQDVLDPLSRRLILRVYINGTYDVHELIKSYYLSRLTEHEKKNYFKIACDYYSTRGSEKDMLEHLRLLLESGQRKPFTTALLENGEFLFSQGHTQITDYVNDIDEDQVKGLDKVRLLILKSDIAVEESRLKQARGLLKRGLKICDTILRSKVGKKKKDETVRQVSRIYTRSAEISKLEGKLDDTLMDHKKSVNLNKKYGDMAGEGKALNNLAMAFRERGELDEALKTLEKAKAIFQELSDPTARALVEVNIGDIYLLKRNFKRSRKHFKIAQETTTKYLPAKGLIFRKIGGANMRTGDYASASKSLKQALAAYMDTADVTNQITCLGDLFKCACTRAHLKSVEKLLAAYSREFGDSVTTKELVMDHVKNRLVFASLWERKGLSRTVKEYLDLITEVGKLRQVLDQLEDLSSEIEEGPALLALYMSLEKGLQRVKAKHPFIIVSIRRASLLTEMGRKKEAKAVLKKMHPLAKQIGFTKAQKRIEEMLK